MNPLFGIVTPVVVPITQPTPVDIQSGWGADTTEIYNVVYGLDNVVYGLDNVVIAI